MPKEARVRERLVASIQELFDSRDYAPIETPTLESMDVMNRGGHTPATPIKLFDSAGDLLAMRPDVTLQIARMCATRLADQEGPFRFRYSQRVFRETEPQFDNRESTQIGLECIGASGPEVDAEVVGLLVEALLLAGLRDFKISIGTVAVLQELLDAATDDEALKTQIKDAYHESNFVEVEQLCACGAGRADVLEAVAQLPRIRGGREAIDEVRALAEPFACTRGLDHFVESYNALEAVGLAERIMVDFSVISSFDYYTGMHFEVYAAGLGAPLGAGGRYDNVLGIYGKERPAAGFAFYLEPLMRVLAQQELDDDERPLRIAVPKGSLNSDSIACLKAAGLDTTGLENPDRKLIIRNPGVEYIIVRAQDAPAFVSLGGADCGICGEDSLVEANLDVVELVDLKFGGCRFVVAEPEGHTATVENRYFRLGSIRVATKYPRITRRYYDSIGVQVEIVQLHGNIELGPLIGMAERIVDITATGTTLRENNLVIVDDVMETTARFFANTCAFRTNPRITALAKALSETADQA